MSNLIEEERVRVFLLSLTEKQEDYLLEKQALETEKAELILNTNWDELNKERKEQGLPKISNESSRNAYISLQLADNIAKFNEVKLEYDNAKRYYKYLIASMRMEE
jgi:hypothetical protein